MIRKLLVATAVAIAPIGAVAVGIAGTATPAAAASPINCAVSGTITFAPPRSVVHRHPDDSSDEHHQCLDFRLVLQLVALLRALRPCRSSGSRASARRRSGWRLRLVA